MICALCNSETENDHINCNRCNELIHMVGNNLEIVEFMLLKMQKNTIGIDNFNLFHVLCRSKEVSYTLKYHYKHNSCDIDLQFEAMESIVIRSETLPFCLNRGVKLLKEIKEDE